MNIEQVALRFDAETLRRIASVTRQNAQYAEGQAYREELALAKRYEARADELEDQARKLEAA